MFGGSELVGLAVCFFLLLCVEEVVVCGDDVMVRVAYIVVCEVERVEVDVKGVVRCSRRRWGVSNKMLTFDD